MTRLVPLQQSYNTRKHPRTMQEAFGPYCDHELRPMPDPGKPGGLLGADALLECKTGGAHSAAEWGDDDAANVVPLHYVAQALWYLAVRPMPEPIPRAERLLGIALAVVMGLAFAVLLVYQLTKG